MIIATYRCSILSVRLLNAALLALGLRAPVPEAALAVPPLRAVVSSVRVVSTVGHGRLRERLVGQVGLDLDRDLELELEPKCNPFTKA